MYGFYLRRSERSKRVDSFQEAGMKAICGFNGPGKCIQHVGPTSAAISNIGIQTIKNQMLLTYFIITF